MKTLTSATLTQAAAEGQSPCILCLFEDWGGVDVAWALSDAPVVYGGVTYQPRYFQPGSVTASQAGSSSQATMTFDNADLALSALCAADEPVGCHVTLRRVFLDNLAAAHVLVAGLEVAAYRLTESQATFTLVSGSALAPQQVPARVASHACRWEYLDATTCRYVRAVPTTAADATCDHTLEACRTRAAGSNLLNYGGIPPVVPQRY